MVLCKGAICDLVKLIFTLSKLAMGIANGSQVTLALKNIL